MQENNKSSFKLILPDCTLKTKVQMKIRHSHCEKYILPWKLKFKTKNRTLSHYQK